MQKEQFLGRELTGGYSLQEVLGKGGFGVAFLATYQHDNSLVAVKLFDPENSSIPKKEEFRQEARRLGYLHHPHIIPFYWYDVEQVHSRDDQDKELVQEYPFIVMMYANKGSVGKYIKEKGILPTAEAVDFLVQASLGLQYAHKRKYVHRDIKPDNLLLHHYPGNEHLDVLVSDFGIAIKAHSEHSLTPQDGALSPAYAAPEQFDGRATPVSDVYELGVTAFELLTGRRPFKPDHPAGYEFAHRYQPPPSFRDIRGEDMNTELEALEEVVGKALSKKPLDRYDSIGAFSHDLNERYIKAVEEQEKQKRIFDENQVKLSLLFEQGKRFQYLGKFEEALLAYDEAIRLDPNNSGAFIQKGDVLVGLVRYEEALLVYDEAIRLDPKNRSMFNNKGFALAHLGRYEEALLVYDEAIRLDPKNRSISTTKVLH